MGKNMVDLKYKMQLVIEVEGHVEEDSKYLTDADNIGFGTFVQWATDDLEAAIKGECKILKIQKVELEAGE